jgi:hypothetical protein
MVGFIREQKELFTTLATIAAIYYGYQKRTFLLDKATLAYKKLKIMFGKRELAQEGAIAGVKALSNPARALAGLAAAALVFGAINKYTKVDDYISEGSSGGYGKRALLEEGELTLFNDRDTLIAGTNLGGGGSTSSNNGTVELIKEVKELKSTFIKGLQPQLLMDGQALLKGLSRVGNETTKNNFSLNG